MIGTQGIQFILMIVLARLLLPEDFGLVVIVSIFITIAGVFIERGFSEALIQKKNPDELDFSSVFYLNIIVALVLYGLLFYTSPFISLFFEEPKITLILRVLSFVLFFKAFNLVHNVILSKSMQYKKLFLSSLGAIIFSSFIGITMAYSNFAVWSLVGQQLSYQLLFTMILWFVVGWRPKLIFSLERIGTLFSFGSRLLLSSILYIIYINLQSFVVGKMYNATVLGYYNRGMQLPSTIVNNFNGSIQTILFPALSSQQDNKNAVKAMLRKTVVTSSFIIFPLMVGLAVTAESVIKILLNDQWLPTVPFLQIFCAYYTLWPLDTSNIQVIKALGLSKLYLKLEILKTIFGLIMLIIAIQFGAHALAWGVFASGIFSLILGGYNISKIVNYSYIEQLTDIIPPLFLSLMMGGIVGGIESFEWSTTIILLLQIITGAVVYVGVSTVFRLKGFNYLLWALHDLKKSKTKVDRV